MDRETSKIRSEHIIGLNFIIALLPLCAFAVYMYRLRAFVLLVLALLTALLCDLFVSLIRGAKRQKNDLSSYAYSLMLALLLPASVSYYVLIVGVIVSVIIGKHAFGGYPVYPFNPAALGFAVVSISWPDSVFKYPKPFSSLPLLMSEEVPLYNSPAYVLKYGGVPPMTFRDLIVGDYAGPMGATVSVVMVAVAVYLIATCSISWRIPLSFIGICALFTALFPRIPAPFYESVIYELFSGALLFAAAFLIADPVTSPARAKAQWVYGALLGLVAMLYRYYGVYELGVCFALLIANPLSGYLDRVLTDKKAVRK